MIYRGPGYVFSRLYDLTPPHRVLTPQTPRRQVEIIGASKIPPSLTGIGERNCVFDDPAQKQLSCFKQS